MYKNTTADILLRRLIITVGIGFIFELILGFNGTLLVINQRGIRKILYVLFMSISGIYILKEIRTKDLKRMLKCTIPLDWILLLFLGAQAIWIFIIPLIMRQQITLALKESLCLTTLLIYFTLSFMIEQNYLSWDTIKGWIKYTTISLAIVHIILFIGETIFTDATFSLGFFKMINIITNGHSIRPLVAMPAHYIRIIYACSIFLLLPFYFIFAQIKWAPKTWCYYITAVLGLLSTISKAMFLGFILGISIYLIRIISTYYSKSKSKVTCHILSLFVTTLCITLLFDTFVSDGYISRRCLTMFSVKAADQQDLGYEPQEAPKTKIGKDQNVLEGSERSNYTRITQTKQLIAYWQKHWLWGYGYGSYIPDYMRGSSETPYSYEMFLPALLMKVGILGISLWIGITLYLFGLILSLKDKYKERVFALEYLFIALIVTIQFNPMLMNSSGLSILLFILLELRVMIRQAVHISTNTPQ